MDISIFGLGYVGCVGLGCMASNGHHVIGVDINETKVEFVNQGRSPIVERGLDRIIEEQRASGRISATTDVGYAVANSEVSFICVGTPAGPTGHLDHGALFGVMEQIGAALAQKAAFHVLVIRSTVFPGTAERACRVLQEFSGKRRGTDFAVVVNPEFLREGTAVEDYFSPPYTLLGGDNDAAVDRVRSIYAKIDAPILTTDFRTAEMIKHVNNAFHALKITFANEVGNICKGLGVDSHRLMDIFCRDRKLNISPAYLKPGFAYGGSCLPKDLKALNILAHDLYLETPVLANIEKSNELQRQRLLSLILSLDRKKLGFLGLSFKAGTDDLRNSPIVDVIEQLIGKGFQVRIYDRNVNLANLVGANRAYILQRIPLISEFLSQRPEEIISWCEAVVVVNKEKEFCELLPRLPKETAILDLVNAPFSGREARDSYIGFAW